MKSKTKELLLSNIEKNGSSVDDVEVKMNELRKQAEGGIAGMLSKMIGQVPDLGWKGMQLGGLAAGGIGGLAGLGAYKGYQSVQDSQDKLKKRQEEIEQYRNAIQQLEQNMQSPANI